MLIMEDFVLCIFYILLNLTRVSVSQGLYENEVSIVVVDHHFPLIISNKRNESRISSTLFGMSVALSSGPGPEFGDYKSRPSGWIFIGAPVSNSTYANPTIAMNEPGVIWRCSLGRRDNEDTCEIVKIDPTDSTSKSPKRKGGAKFEDEGNSWIGVSTEVRNGRLVTCGHRWTRGRRSFMNGICYFLPAANIFSISFNNENLDESNLIAYEHSHRLIPFFNSSDTNKSIDQLLDPIDNSEIVYEFGNGQAGVSLHITNNSELLLGAPGVRSWSGAVVKYSDSSSNPISTRPQRSNLNVKDPIFSEYLIGYREKLNQENLRNYSYNYFGYGVSSGRYFSKNKTLYSAGAPRGYDLMGEVVIFDYLNETDPSTNNANKRNIAVKRVLRGPPKDGMMGSYFGSVLFSMDVDQDGFDELFVGAPFYSFQHERIKRRVTPGLGKDSSGDVNRDTIWTGDHGCVFVYLQLAENKTSEPLILSGNKIPGSRFGSAISYVNMIGKKYLESYAVISAPYEENGRGAIYFYRTKNLKGGFVQRISAKELSLSLYGFGCSISLPKDIDSNGTPDIAVGSFTNNSVVVLRTRPRIQMNGTIEFPDETKIFKGGNEMIIKACIQVDVLLGEVADKLEVWAKLTLDTRMSFSSKDNDTLTERIYKQSIITSSRNCSEILTKFNDGVLLQVEDAETDPEPFIIKLQTWYNETSESNVTLVEYNAFTGVKSKVNISGGGDFKSFGSRKPGFSSSEIITKSLEIPRDCGVSVCRPDLILTAEWFYSEDSSRNIPINESEIGTKRSPRYIILRVNVSNSGDKAVKPQFNIEWPSMGVIASKDETNKWLYTHCSEHHQTHFIFNCKLKKNVLKNRDPITQEFQFDLAEVFPEGPVETFAVTIIVYPQGQHLSEFERNLTVSMSLKSSPSPTVRLFAVPPTSNVIFRNTFAYNCSIKSASGSTIEVTQLYSGEKQLYRAQVSTNVKLMKLEFLFPLGRRSVEGFNRKISLVQLENVSSNDKKNLKCSVVPTKEVKYCDTGSKYYDGNAHESSLKAGSIRPLDSSSASTISTEETQDPVSVDRMPHPEQFHNQTLFKIENNMAYIFCDDETDPEMICMQIICKAEDVKAETYVEVGFIVYLDKDSFDEELAKDGKEILVIESKGEVTIFESEKSGIVKSQIKYVRVFGVVSTWVYVISIISGVCAFLGIIFILYKCGFFKRNHKEQLKDLKAEVRKSMLLTNNFNFNEDVNQRESREDLLPVDSKKMNSDEVEDSSDNYNSMDKGLERSSSDM